MIYQIWAEGYRATGEQGTATHFGGMEAKSFQQACDQFFDPPQHRAYYDATRLTYWGCQLFDNEADARKRFG